MSGQAFSPKTHLITSPRSNSTGQIHLYVRVPQLGGYSLKLFKTTLTIQEVIERLNKSLPPHIRSDKYHLFLNGLELLDTERTLQEARIPDKASVELKRGVEFDLKIIEGKPNPDGEALCYISEHDTVEEATKKACSHAFGEKVYRSQLKNYDFSITNEGLDLKEKFITYKFQQGDVIELKAVPKAGGNIIYKTLEVTYSPITARLEQQKMLSKSGFLKKQGLKNKTWKKRWFVLDTEKLQYFDVSDTFRTALIA